MPLHDPELQLVLSGRKRALSLIDGSEASGTPAITLAVRSLLTQGENRHTWCLPQRVHLLRVPFVVAHLAFDPAEAHAPAAIHLDAPLVHLNREVDLRPDLRGAPERVFYVHLPPLLCACWAAAWAARRSSSTPVRRLARAPLSLSTNSCGIFVTCNVRHSGDVTPGCPDRNPRRWEQRLVRWHVRLGLLAGDEGERHEQSHKSGDARW